MASTGNLDLEHGDYSSRRVAEGSDRAAASQRSGDPSEPLEEIREQLAAWAREMEAESSSSPAAEPPSVCVPRPTTPDSATAYVEFLEALSHEELLRTAIELQAERDTLFRQLGSLPDLSQLDSMRHRFQQAIEEIELLRERNEQLEVAVSTASADEDSSSIESLLGEASSDAAEDEERDFESDWETQKSEWLHRLQGDTDEVVVSVPAPDSKVDRAKSKQQRSRIQQLEADLAALKQRLEEKNSTEMLVDADEAIIQERARLKSLQDEWHAKMRHEEIELSQERALLTRTRMKLEERESTLAALRERLERQQSQTETTGKWRDFLGLK